MKRVLLAILLLAASATVAAAVATIEAVQLPAWLDRGGLSVPAAPGTELQAGDTLRTGRGARLLLKLSEGSVVKLGENAQFTLESADRKNKVFQAALSVLTGAFRFTTSALTKSQPRDVQVKVARNFTIGIRGTDLWGRGREDKDIVCLIEGKIDVTGNDSKTEKLDQPLQFFRSTRTAPPEPVALLEAKQLEVWAAETELSPGKGAIGSGHWKVVIAGLASRDAAQAASRQLRGAGYPVEKSGELALSIGRINGEAEAKDLADRLMAEFGFADVKVSK
ncbi:MAG: FecR domain-containing protein [Betaproteobacteria bacterium]|nr:FecR domain-containing protein [Betaproteobacteria bacterium]